MVGYKVGGMHKAGGTYNKRIVEGIIFAAQEVSFLIYTKPHHKLMVT